MTSPPAADGLTRRRLLSTTAASALAIGLAGCGGDGGDGGEGESGGQLDPMGEVTGTVDGIEIDDLESYMGQGGSSAGSERFSVDVTVENTGDETIEPLGYTYDLRLFDENDEEAYQRSLASQANDFSVEPGDTGSVTVWNTNADDESAIDHYEIAVTCDGSFADGVYCE